MAMTPRERFLKTISFEDVDRVPVMDFGYWEKTIRLWHMQGLPKDINTTEEVEAYLGLDRGFETNLVNYWDKDKQVGYLWGIYPPFEKKIIDETETTITYGGEGGVVIEHKESGSIPHHLKHPVETMEDFKKKVVPRMNARDTGRVQPEFYSMVKKGKSTDQAIGVWIDGFLAWPRILVGIENLSFFYFDKPELIHAINEHHVQFIKDYINVTLRYTNLDYTCFFEDMAYKNGSLVSPKIFDEFMTPYYLEVIDFLKSKGIQKILVDSDGNTLELCQKFVDIGVDAHYPLEVQAGTDPKLMVEKYPEMAFIGGIDKSVLSLGRKAIDEELSKLPPLLEHGGFIPALDHRVPPNVSFDNYKYYVEGKRKIIERYGG